jgi:hypothetical protein
MAAWKNVQISWILPKRKKKARVYTLIFVFDQASIPWQLWVLNPLAACMQDFAKIFWTHIIQMFGYSAKQLFGG